MKGLVVALVLFTISISITHAASRALLQDLENGPARPPYDVINKTEGYELRKYDNGTWAMSFARARFGVDLAAVKAGWGLAGYFKGANKNQTHLGVSVPILGTIIKPPPPPPPPHEKNGSHPHPGPPYGNHSHPHPHPPGPPHRPGPPAVVLAAYIPKKYQDDPPKPLDRSVKILRTNATEVYVRSFGGWAISWFLPKQIHRLAEALKADGICPRKGKFFVATYDPPFKFTGRHNEVWWVKRPKHGHHNHSSEEAAFQLPLEHLLTAAQGFSAIDPMSFPELLLGDEDHTLPKPDFQPPYDCNDLDEGCKEGNEEDFEDGYEEDIEADSTPLHLAKFKTWEDGAAKVVHW